MKIITADENKVFIYDEVKVENKCTILYTPLTFDENLVSEIDYIPDIIEI